MAEKRIMIVTSEVVPFHYGGIGTQFKSLATLLSRQGHRISLLARRPDSFDANLYRSHYGETPIFFVDTPPAYTWPPSYFVYAAEVARRFDEIYPQVRPDLVIFADFNAEGFLLLLRSVTGAYEDTKFLLTINGMNAEVIAVREGCGPNDSATIMEHPEIRLLLAMEDLCVHFASRIISPSFSAWEEVRKRLGICKTARIIPNLVDPDLFDPDNLASQEVTREPLILFVGRLDRMKGTDLLLKAYFEIAEQMQPATPRIIFIGRDCYWNEYGSTFLEYWKDRIPKRYVDSVSFLGQVSHDSIRNFLKKASVAVFPSRWEPFGIVCLEAISMGCPVVVSKGTGLEEVIGPELSELAVPVTEDIQPLVKKILYFLQMEKHVPAAGSRSRYSVPPQHLRARALALVQKAEKEWLDVLSNMDCKEENSKSDIHAFCGPLHQLLVSLSDSTWRSATFLQIYFRCQGGYTEARSLKLSYSRLCWATLNIPLPEGSGENPLRLDPSDAPGIIRIKEVVLFDEKDKEIWRTDRSTGFQGCSPVGVESMSIEDSCIFIHARTNDPQIFLDCPATDRPLKMQVVIYASGE